MVLEATMICIDNSEWMRNGDFPPTRMRAQTEAIRFLCFAIFGSNSEHMVGLLTMAGKEVDALIPPTSNMIKILRILRNIEIGGEANLKIGMKVAQILLKHRHNKSHSQRIIVFTGGPWGHKSRNELEMIGGDLRKNSVALDVVKFDDGQDKDIQFDKIKALIDATGCNSNHNIAYVPRCSCLTVELMSGRYRLFTHYYSNPTLLEAQLTFAINMEEERRANEEEAAAAVAVAAAAEEDAERGKNGSSQQSSSEANNNTRNDQTAKALDLLQKALDMLQNALDLLQKALAMSKDESLKSPYQNGISQQSSSEANNNLGNDQTADD